MRHQTFEPFNPQQPLLLGVSTITLAEALACEQLLVDYGVPPSAEDSGQVLLVSTNFCLVKNPHLEASKVRFLVTPVGEAAMHVRIKWMWHAGSRSPDLDLRPRANEAISLMVDQLAPGDLSDPETLAGDLAAIQEDHPEIIAALFAGDLDDLPDMIDAAVKCGGDEADLVSAAAWMFVAWGALEQQREACLGWRLLHRPLDEVWGQAGDKPFTLGQVFRPQLKRDKFAREIAALYEFNRVEGLDTVRDKRKVNRIERTLTRMGLGGFNRANEREIITHFGHGRLGSILIYQDRFEAAATKARQDFEAILAHPSGKSRAGQRADMLVARISAVHRTAIVCARTFDLAALAGLASVTDALRVMLDAQLPAVLKPNSANNEDTDKFGLRQLFHIVRLEFLRDGEHLPKAAKGATKTDPSNVPLDLDVEDRRRGHEIFDNCWAELNDQPAGWRFMAPLGWQCDKAPRIRLSASLPATISEWRGYSSEALDQFGLEREYLAAKQQAAAAIPPFASPSRLRPLGEGEN